MKRQESGNRDPCVDRAGAWTDQYLRLFLDSRLRYRDRDLVADLLSNIASDRGQGRIRISLPSDQRQLCEGHHRFLLNREEAHNALFRDAFNKVQNNGSNKVSASQRIQSFISICRLRRLAIHAQNMNVNPRVSPERLVKRHNKQLWIHSLAVYIINSNYFNPGCSAAFHC
jgi:hypothetical protein